MRFLRIGGGLFDGTLRRAGHELLPFGEAGGGAAPAAGAAQTPGAAPAPEASPAAFHGDPFRDPETARSRLAGAVEAFRPDWILQVDDSTPLVHLGLERFPVRKAWYAVDSHLHAWHPHYAVLFDRVFCAQANQVERLGAYLGAATWLPPGFGGEPWAADLRLAPDGRRLYATERRSSTLVWFEVAPDSGELTVRGHLPTEQTPRSLAVDPSGRCVVVAGQGTHAIALYAIDAGGAPRLAQRCDVGRQPCWVEIAGAG